MHDLIFSISLIPILGIVSQWIAWKIRFPSIVVLLITGFLIGPVFGVLNTDQLFGDLIYPLVSILVAIILFEGGLNLRVFELKKIGRPLFRLVFIGPLITIALLFGLTKSLLGLSSEISLLFSALMVISGPTVIIPLLRHIKVSPKMSALIRWEGILIDPIGAILIVLVYQFLFISSDHLFLSTILIIFKTIAVSTVFSLLGVSFIILFFKKSWIPDFLQELTTLIMVISVFVLSDFVQQDSGILTVVLSGIILANQNQISLQHVKVFKENLSILFISVLFIILSSRLVISDLTSLIDLKHGLYLLSLIFIVRPVSTFISLFKTSLSYKERSLMAWIAPRGIVTAALASLFSLRLVEMNVPQAETLVPLTFSVLIFTVLIYGLTLNPVINFFKLFDHQKMGVLIVGANKVSSAIAKLIQSIDNIDVMVVDSNKKRVQFSRIDGLKSIHASVFSKRISEEMHLGAYKNMISLTENDEVNTLACIQYSEILGKRNVFRFPPTVFESSHVESVNSTEFGQSITPIKYGYHFLNNLFSNNDSFKLITIISDLSHEEFEAVYGEGIIPILGISKTSSIITSLQNVSFNKDEKWIVIDKRT